MNKIQILTVIAIISIIIGCGLIYEMDRHDKLCTKKITFCEKVECKTHGTNIFCYLEKVECNGDNRWLRTTTVCVN